MGVTRRLSVGEVSTFIVLVSLGRGLEHHIVLQEVAPSPQNEYVADKMMHLALSRPFPVDNNIQMPPPQ